MEVGPATGTLSWLLWFICKWGGVLGLWTNGNRLVRFTRRGDWSWGCLEPLLVWKQWCVLGWPFCMSESCRRLIGQSFVSNQAIKIAAAMFSVLRSCALTKFVRMVFSCWVSSSVICACVTLHAYSCRRSKSSPHCSPVATVAPVSVWAAWLIDAPRAQQPCSVLSRGWTKDSNGCYGAIYFDIFLHYLLKNETNLLALKTPVLNPHCGQASVGCLWSCEPAIGTS